MGTTLFLMGNPVDLSFKIGYCLVRKYSDLNSSEQPYFPD